MSFTVVEVYGSAASSARCRVALALAAQAGKSGKRVLLSEHGASDLRLLLPATLLVDSDSEADLFTVDGLPKDNLLIALASGDDASEERLAPYLADRDLLIRIHGSIEGASDDVNQVLVGGYDGILLRDLGEIAEQLPESILVAAVPDPVPTSFHRTKERAIARVPVLGRRSPLELPLFGYTPISVPNGDSEASPLWQGVRSVLERLDHAKKRRLEAPAERAPAGQAVPSDGSASGIPKVELPEVLVEPDIAQGAADPARPSAALAEVQESAAAGVAETLEDLESDAEGARASREQLGEQREREWSDELDRTRSIGDARRENLDSRSRKLSEEADELAAEIEIHRQRASELEEQLSRESRERQERRERRKQEREDSKEREAAERQERIEAKQREEKELELESELEQIEAKRKRRHEFEAARRHTLEATPPEQEPEPAAVGGASPAAAEPEIREDAVQADPALRPEAEGEAAVLRMAPAAAEPETPAEAEQADPALQPAAEVGAPALPPQEEEATAEPVPLADDAAPAIAEQEIAQADPAPEPVADAQEALPPQETAATAQPEPQAEQAAPAAAEPEIQPQGAQAAAPEPEPSAQEAPPAAEGEAAAVPPQETAATAQPEPQAAQAAPAAAESEIQPQAAQAAEPEPEASAQEALPAAEGGAAAVPPQETAESAQPEPHAAQAAPDAEEPVPQAETAEAEPTQQPAAESQASSAPEAEIAPPPAGPAEAQDAQAEPAGEAAAPAPPEASAEAAAPAAAAPSSEVPGAQLEQPAPEEAAGQPSDQAGASLAEAEPPQAVESEASTAAEGASPDEPAASEPGTAPASGGTAGQIDTTKIVRPGAEVSFEQFVDIAGILRLIRYQGAAKTLAAETPDFGPEAPALVVDEGDKSHNRHRAIRDWYRNLSAQLKPGPATRYCALRMFALAEEEMSTVTAELSRAFAIDILDEYTHPDYDFLIAWYANSLWHLHSLIAEGDYDRTSTHLTALISALYTTKEEFEAVDPESAERRYSLMLSSLVLLSIQAVTISSSATDLAERKSMERILERERLHLSDEYSAMLKPPSAAGVGSSAAAARDAFEGM